MSPFRRRVGAALVGHTQLPLQAGPAARAAVHLPGQARLGAVFLQGSPQRGERTDAQKPTGTTDSSHVTQFQLTAANVSNGSRLGFADAQWRHYTLQRFLPSTGLHNNESHRSQPGASHPGGKQQ